MFVANLALGLAGLAVCLWHAWGTAERVTLLATATVYGVVLEQLVILRFERYVYSLSEFLLTVGDVPVVIGFGWGAIVYGGIALADELGITGRARPAFVGLYALHVDLAIDAVAIRIPFWRWTPPGVWFGVPLGNFTGWFLVATLFPAAWAALTDRLPARGVGAVGRGLGTILAAVAGLIVLLELWDALTPTLAHEIVVLGGTLALALVAVARHGVSPAPVDPRVTAVPVLYHGGYLGYYLALGLYRDVPALLGVSLAMLAVTALLHAGGLPWLARRVGSDAS